MSLQFARMLEYFFNHAEYCMKRTSGDNQVTMINDESLLLLHKISKPG